VLGVIWLVASRLLTVWPAEYRQWAFDHGPDRQVPEVRESAGARKVRDVRQVRENSLRISSPPDGATYLIDPTLRREFQALALCAVRSTPGPLEWIVHGRSLGTVPSEQVTTWPLAPGRHTFVVRDADGRVAEAIITVR
jgi:membrane carboxypeptidase/penicillin-binding protein PbpC